MKTKRCKFVHVIGYKDSNCEIVDGFYTSLSPKKTQEYVEDVYGDGYVWVKVQMYNCDDVEVLVK